MTVALHFLESGLVGVGAGRTASGCAKARERIGQAAAGIRARDYTPKPEYVACGLLPVPRHLPLERRALSLAIRHSPDSTGPVARSMCSALVGDAGGRGTETVVSMHTSQGGSGRGSRRTDATP
jgi:hypothetical protein